MALPDTTRDQLIAAMLTFDTSGARNTYNWKVNRYVIDHNGKHYPPKVIVSMATGRTVDTFSGGKAGANGYLAKRGFSIIDLAEVGGQSLGLGL